MQLTTLTSRPYEDMQPTCPERLFCPISTRPGGQMLLDASTNLGGEAWVPRAPRARQARLSYGWLTEKQTGYPVCPLQVDKSTRVQSPERELHCWGTRAPVHAHRSLAQQAVVVRISCSHPFAHIPLSRLQGCGAFTTGTWFCGKLSTP